MASTTTTVVGWSVVLAIGGVGYWHYYRSKNDRQRPLQRVDRLHPSERQRSGSKDRRKREKSDKPVQVDEVDSSPSVRGHEQLKKRKKNKDTKQQQGASSSAVNTVPEPTRPSEKEKAADDIAFAQQLASTQSGTTLKAPERSAQQVRTNKVKAGGKESTEWQGSGPSSSAGADADNDTSPVLSPNTKTEAAIHEPAGIEDMLEASTPGPSTLRVTPSEHPQREPTMKKPKPVQEEETKKQRQRRRKREAEKAQAAADEIERRRLMEKQLKTAREAEGTAKSGKYRTYTPPTNAWSKPGESTAATMTTITPVGNSSLLDTFEADTAATVPDSVQPTETHDAPSDESRPSIDSEPASSAAASLAGNHHEPVIVSGTDPSDLTNSGNHTDAWEDYQLRTIEQREKDNGGWQQVATKGKKKAAK